MLRDVSPRLYQETILGTCVFKNALVVLPTGMGKTLIALLLAAQRLKQYPGTKVLLVSPTRPLVEQHFQTFKTHLQFPEDKFAVFTGNIPPEKRAEQWKQAQIIFSTPQGLENDILSKKINFEDVSLFVFDEAHRAVGDYSYVFLAKQYQQKARYPRILALTASPGDDLAKIQEVCGNLSIEGIEVRSPEDPDVKPYVQDVEIDYVKVKLPEEFSIIKKYIESCITSKLEQVKQFGLIQSVHLSKSELLGFQGELHGMLAQGQKGFDILRSISLVAEAMKMQHALELLETQGMSQLEKYISKLEQEALKGTSKAVKNLVCDLNFKSASVKIRSLLSKGIEHPKLDKLAELLGEFGKNEKMIVFTQYRDTASKIKEVLDTKGTTSSIFVGQAKKGETGLTQKQQIEMLKEFSLGLFQVLICTSVAEEGLDIPKVDAVIFYEPIPSAIRAIQRRGRTGRSDKGKVIMLLAEGTRDEGYRWSAHHKEKRMHRLLKDLKTSVQPQPTLASYSKPSTLKIAADFREKGSAVMKMLIENNIDLEMGQLKSADFILSERVGVEYKTVPDFVDSLIDGRLLSQMKELKRNFQRPLVIIEGEQDLYSVRKVHPNALQGMLAAITVSFGIPVLQTKNARETAGILETIARREQEDNAQAFSMHTHKKGITLGEQQEYIVGSLPGVGPALAKPLLRAFGSIKKMVNATEDELQQVELIGKQKAKAIREVLDEEWKD